MANTLLTSIRVISKTHTEWVSQNPILLLTQAAYSTDTRELKIGNGSLHWVDLPVDSSHGSVPSHSHIHHSDGRDPITPADILAAPVDGNNKVPVANLPVATTAVQGITQLNDTLTSTSTNLALTAAQGKVLKDAVDTKEVAANKNAVNGYAGLGSDGKILESLLPSIALVDTFEAASQTAMLALSTARRGDICIRSDINKTFILSVDGYSVLSNWKELRTPTDAVLSVAGKTGAVTLSKSDVGLANVDNTSDTNKPVSTAAQTALNGKVDKTTTINSKALSADVVLTTANIADSTDKRYSTDLQKTQFAAAYTHAVSAHAPTNAQKNSDITKAEIEAKLTGTIASHQHSFTSENITIQNSAPQINFVDVDWGNRYLHCNGGNIGFLTSGGGWAFRVDNAGNAVATADVVAYSDIRLKKDLDQIKDALSKVGQLTGYTFTRRDTGQRHTGLIAQDVQKVLPEAITNMDDYLTLAYGSLAGLLVEAIKELTDRVVELENKLK